MNWQTTIFKEVSGTTSCRGPWSALNSSFHFPLRLMGGSNPLKVRGSKGPLSVKGQTVNIFSTGWPAASVRTLPL